MNTSSEAVSGGRSAPLCAALALLALFLGCVACRADGAPALPDEGAGVPAGEAEWVYCGCTDTPRKHFPYSVVVFKTGAGDLVARPERHELAVTFTVLAIRYGDRYCSVDLEEPCYGSFSHPCEFTDFRYGTFLEQFFPTCKSDEGGPDAPREHK